MCSSDSNHAVPKFLNTHVLKGVYFFDSSIPLILTFLAVFIIFRQQNLQIDNYMYSVYVYCKVKTGFFSN